MTNDINTITTPQQVRAGEQHAPVDTDASTPDREVPTGDDTIVLVLGEGLAPEPEDR